MVFDDHIKVYDFWDVRREPNYLVKNNPKNKYKQQNKLLTF